MQITVVLVDKSGKSSDFVCTPRRAPKNFDALLNTVDSAGHEALVSRLETMQGSHILSDDELDLKSLQEQVDADDLDYCTLAEDVQGEDDSVFQNLADGGKLYLYELPNKTPAPVAAPVAAKAAEVGGDANMLTIVVKVHGGDKRNVEVPYGTLVSDALAKSGIRIPAGASYAFGGTDIKGTDALQHGGMLTVAGKVTGG